MEENTPSQTTVIENQPVKKSNKKWWIIGIVVVLFLCLIASGIAALFGFGVFKFYSAVSEPVGPIKGQLKATNEGDLKAAYSYCSKRFKEETPYEDFVHIIKSNPQVFKSKRSSFTQVNIKNGVATVSGTITGKDGAVTPMVYQLVKEKGKWKILFFTERGQHKKKGKTEGI